MDRFLPGTDAGSGNRRSKTLVRIALVAAVAAWFAASLQISRSDPLEAGFTTGR